MEESQILKILSPLAILTLLWGIYQFYLKRKYEKRDREREQKIKVLTEYLSKLNDLRGVGHKIYNEILKGKHILGKRIDNYRGHFGNIFSKEVIEKNDLLFPRFLEMKPETQVKYFEESAEYFENLEKTSAELKNNLFKLYAEIEEKGLEIKKEALVNVHATTPIFQGQVKLIRVLDDFAEISAEGFDEEFYDIARLYLNSLKEIMEVCYNLEHDLVAEIRKTVKY